jgi:1-pyrroline-5-carboxylate dehydrogenase
LAGAVAWLPRLAGKVGLWKPTRSVLLANYRIMQVLQEAGLPKGVINFVPFDSRYSEVVLATPAFAGLHFTGSYETLVHLWQRIGAGLPDYNNFPCIVARPAVKISSSRTLRRMSRCWRPTSSVGRSNIRQKCSAASRLYVPETLWNPLKGRLLEELPSSRWARSMI